MNKNLNADEECIKIKFLNIVLGVANKIIFS